jgi:hypothetical protein
MMSGVSASECDNGRLSMDSASQQAVVAAKKQKLAIQCRESLNVECMEGPTKRMRLSVTAKPIDISQEDGWVSASGVSNLNMKTMMVQTTDAEAMDNVSDRTLTANNSKAKKLNSSENKRS